MKQTVSFDHNGRTLEARAVVVAGDWQIWIFENGDRIYLHDVLPHELALLEDGNALRMAVLRAQKDVQEERVIVPVVRTLAL